MTAYRRTHGVSHSVWGGGTDSGTQTGCEAGRSPYSDATADEIGTTTSPATREATQTINPPEQLRTSTPRLHLIDALHEAMHCRRSGGDDDGYWCYQHGAPFQVAHPEAADDPNSRAGCEEAVDLADRLLPLLGGMADV